MLAPVIHRKELVELEIRLQRHPRKDQTAEILQQVARTFVVAGAVARLLLVVMVQIQILEMAVLELFQPSLEAAWRMQAVVVADHLEARLERLEPAAWAAVETEQTPVRERQELPTQAVAEAVVAQGLAPVVRAHPAVLVS